jgi:hypothetical protein
VSVREVDPTVPGAESIGFELDRLDRDGERGLEVRGRWSGIRGRRFVRPTLTMRIDGAKHRLLADLEHKPWEAVEGEEWVALFSPAPPAGEVDRIELSVAPDITVSLSPSGLPGPSPTVKRPTNGARAPARRAPRRKAEADRERPVPEEEGAKARGLARQLEEATAAHARLSAERDALSAERESLRARVVELQGQLKAVKASAKRSLAKARDRLEAERAEATRLRSALDTREAAAREDDGLGRELDAVVAERDAIAAELDAAVDERDWLAAQLTQPPVVRSEHRPVRRSMAARPRSRAHVWAVRVLVLIALCAVLATLAVVLHLAQG